MQDAEWCSNGEFCFEYFLSQKEELDGVDEAQAKGREGTAWGRENGKFCEFCSLFQVAQLFLCL